MQDSVHPQYHRKPLVFKVRKMLVERSTFRDHCPYQCAVKSCVVDLSPNVREIWFVVSKRVDGRLNPQMMATTKMNYQSEHVLGPNWFGLYVGNPNEGTSTPSNK